MRSANCTDNFPDSTSPTMSTQVTVTLPDDLWECAQLWANYSGRPVSEFLAEAIELSVLPLGEAPKPINEWTDEEVLATADTQLPAGVDERLTELLAAQREANLSHDQRDELHRLMLLYQERLLRKAIALCEAVRRGLRESLDS